MTKMLRKIERRSAAKLLRPIYRKREALHGQVSRLAGLSDALHTTERFRRPTIGQLELQVTIEDPKAYAHSWTATIPFRLVPDTELLEDACENELDANRIDSTAAGKKDK